MDRSQFVTDAKAKLDEWDHEITALEARAEAKKEEAKADFTRLVSDAKKHLRQAKEKVDEAREVSSDKWNNVKDDFQRAWELAGSGTSLKVMLEVTPEKE